MDLHTDVLSSFSRVQAWAVKAGTPALAHIAGLPAPGHTGVVQGNDKDQYSLAPGGVAVTMCVCVYIYVCVCVCVCVYLLSLSFNLPLW